MNRTLPKSENQKSNMLLEQRIARLIDLEDSLIKQIEKFESLGKNDLVKLKMQQHKEASSKRFELQQTLSKEKEVLCLT